MNKITFFDIIIGNYLVDKKIKASHQIKREESKALASLKAGLVSLIEDKIGSMNKLFLNKPTGFSVSSKNSLGVIKTVNDLKKLERLPIFAEISLFNFDLKMLNCNKKVKYYFGEEEKISSKGRFNFNLLRVSLKSSLSSSFYRGDNRRKTGTLYPVALFDGYSSIILDLISEIVKYRVLTHVMLAETDEYQMHYLRSSVAPYVSMGKIFYPYGLTPSLTYNNSMMENLEEDISEKELERKEFSRDLYFVVLNLLIAERVILSYSNEKIYLFSDNSYTNNFIDIGINLNGLDLESPDFPPTLFKNLPWISKILSEYLNYSFIKKVTNLPLSLDNPEILDLSISKEMITFFEMVTSLILNEYPAGILEDGTSGTLTLNLFFCDVSSDNPHYTTGIDYTGPPNGTVFHSNDFKLKEETELLEALNGKESIFIKGEKTISFNTIFNNRIPSEQMNLQQSTYLLKPLNVVAKKIANISIETSFNAMEFIYRIAEEVDLKNDNEGTVI